MKKNLLIIHGGGPTAVLNSSLYGVLEVCKRQSKINKILAAKNGTGGLLNEEMIDLSNLESDKLEKLKQTPRSAIGTSRDPLDLKDYEKMVEILLKHNIQYVLFNGGNGTMDACGKLSNICGELNASISVIGIPKTMDNDLSITDHSPGFASAANYIAHSVREVCYDVESLPIHIVLIETGGRNSGWLAASSALADVEGPYKPDLIYLPEVPFSEEKFLDDVKNKLVHKKGMVIVVSEGLRKKDGYPIVDPVINIGRATYFGDVSTYLANLIIKKLGYKARGEKPGLLGRSSIALQSSLDCEEAVLVGIEAVKAVVNGETGKMVAICRKDTNKYEIETRLVPIQEVMMVEKKMPEKYINSDCNGVTQEFIDWCKPFVSDLREMIRII